MTQEELLKLIETAIGNGEKMCKNTVNPLPYKTALDHLQELKKSVIQGYITGTKQSPSDSLGLYVSKEFFCYDEEFAKELSEVTYAFDDYFSLIDPDLEELFKEMDDKDDDRNG